LVKGSNSCCSWRWHIGWFSRGNFITRLLEKKEKLLLKQEVDELNTAILDLQAEFKALK